MNGKIDYRWHYLDIIEIITLTKSHQAKPRHVRSMLSKFNKNHRRDGADEEQFKKLAVLVTGLAERYTVILDVPATPSLSFTYSDTIRTKAMSRSLPQGDSTPFTRCTQSLLGINSSYITLALPQARITQSYHLHLSVPDGSYIGRATVVASADALVANLYPERITTVPYLRPIHLDKSSLHVYGRCLGELPIGAEIEGRIYERPLGTEMYGAFACAALLVLCIILRNSFLNGETSERSRQALLCPSPLQR